MVCSVILGGGLSGAGYTKQVMLVVGASLWLIRIPAAYLFGVILGFGAPGVWWSMNLSMLFQFIFMTRQYRQKMRLAITK
jgi:Na+-driven multidrug efflux pump